MRGQATRERGSILIIVIILAMGLAFGVTILLQHAEVEARATRMRLGAVRALYDGYAQLESAKAVIAAADYDAMGHNLAIQAALATASRKIAGTEVVVEPMTGTGGTWYSLTSTIPYADVYERVVRQAFREIDFFSSYNLFVSDDPAGISGSPIGAIHTNEEIQFYFPGGQYRHSVTAVDGYAYKSGATVGNTGILGPFNPAAKRIDIDYEGSDRYSLTFIAANADPSLNFDATLDTKIRLYSNVGQQWARVERWTKPRVDTITEQVLVRYDSVNPRDETYTYTQRVSTGFVTQTRQVSIFDHYDTVQEAYQQPVYVQDVRTVQVPIYRTDTRVRQVPVYRTETRTRTVTRTVWIPLDGGTGGTTVGGDTGTLGYWGPQNFEETYTVQVIDHYNDESYTVQVIDHYEDQQQTYQRLDHYETLYRDKQVAVYRTETQEYQVETFQDNVLTGTRTVYDQVPVYETQTRTVYVAPQLQATYDRQVPDNGLIYCGGDVKSLRGTIVERVTVASGNSIIITGDLVYKDAEGDTAYKGGKEPWLPYEPNPNYSNHAILGIIAKNDVLYGRSLPDNSEINASILAITGRVGIEGIVLDDDGEVVDFNVLNDDWGRRTASTFRKNSIRRLGGITTARRPVETVVRSGGIVSGFNVGQSVFDVGLLEGPPPFFLAYPIPRFFATTIVK